MDLARVGMKSAIKLVAKTWLQLEAHPNWINRIETQGAQQNKKR